jgi:hypothetical protein
MSQRIIGTSNCFHIACKFVPRQNASTAVIVRTVNIKSARLFQFGNESPFCLDNFILGSPSVQELGESCVLHWREVCPSAEELRVDEWEGSTE